MEVLGVKKIYKGIKSQVLDEHPWASKTKEATNSDAWGPTGTQLKELASATGFGPQVFNEIFSVLYERLDERDTKWRKCYKALVVIDFLLLRGDEHCINPIRIGRFAPKLRSLLQFGYLEPTTGRDVGASIRKKVQAILELVEDEANVMEVRKKALGIRDCVGISSEDNVFSNVKSKDIQAETYTVGRNNSVRDAESHPTNGGGIGPFSKNGSWRNAKHDDWGDDINASGYSSGKSVPKSIIESPEMHKVTINRNKAGKVSSIEGRKVNEQAVRSSDTDYYGGFITAAPSGQPASEVQVDSKPVTFVQNKSHPKLLDAPPGTEVFVDSNFSNLAPSYEAAFSSAPSSVAQVPQGMPLNDIFMENEPMKSEVNVLDESHATVSNPFTAVLENLPITPSEVAPSQPEQDPFDIITPNSDLHDWTSKAGFDFTNLNLDTSPTTRTPPSTKVRGPSMKSMKKGWEKF